MTDIRAVFNAGRVRRWHSNPILSWTSDYLDGHQGRVARLLLALHPRPSERLLVAALTHDDGESGPGDMSAEFKKANPNLRAAVKAAEEETFEKIWGVSPPENGMPKSDVEWLKFADRLDSYMWMMHHRPELAKKDDWIIARNDLMKFATFNGIAHLVEKAI